MGVIINVDADAPRVGVEASFPRIRYNEEYNWIFSALNLSESKSLASLERGNLNCYIDKMNSTKRTHRTNHFKFFYSKLGVRVEREASATATVSFNSGATR